MSHVLQPPLLSDLQPLDAAPAPPAEASGLGDALAFGPRGLELDGVPLADVAREHGTPVYVYGAATLRRRLAELRAALASTGAPSRLHYAMKGCRFAPVLDLIRREGDIGIDAVAPREVERALAAGFVPAEISMTASMLSNRELRQLHAWGVHLDLDSRSALRRWSAICGAGKEVGLSLAFGRLGVEAGHEEGSGPQGFVASSIETAEYAASLGLVLDQLHVQAGGGWQVGAAPQLAAAFARLARIARAIPSVRTLHVGGGLCRRERAGDEPLSPASWAELLRDHLAPTGCTLVCDPGAFFAASSGVLLADADSVEGRSGPDLPRLDAGGPVAVYAAGPHGARTASAPSLRGAPVEILL